MKFNLSFGRGRGGGGNKLNIKQFLLQHAEKILLGVACLVMVVLLALGYRSGSQFDSTRNPASLSSQVNSTQTKINAPRWDIYRPQRDRADRRPLTDRAQEALVQVSIESYPTPMPWKPLIFPPQTKREDPTLLPVQDLTAKGGYGALAVRRDERAGPGGRSEGEIDEYGAQDLTRPLPVADEAELVESSDSVGGQAEGIHFVCLTGLIPFQEQLKQYNQCFEMAAGHDLGRDYPKYFTFKVQRAEIQPGGGEPQWVDLDWPTNRKDQRYREIWGGRPQQLADPLYVLQSNGFIETTFQLPPLLRQDMTKWALHPGIPRAKDEYVSETEMVEEEMDQGGETDPFSQRGSFGFGSREEGSGEEEMAGPRSRSTWRQGVGEEGRIAEGSESYGDRDAVTEFKLFRCFDFNVQPGKIYQYRAQLWLEDPNYPLEERYRLGLRMLSTEAADRVRPKMETVNRANHYRATAWSEPTEPVTVPLGNEVLVGTVTARGQIPLGRSRNVRIDKPYDEPRAKVVVMDWDIIRAASVPVETELRRGSVANFTMETEFLRPTERILEKVTHPFDLNTVVVDIAGGQPLASAIRSESLTSPGEMLLLDAAGNLIVRNELDDLKAYQQNTFLPPGETDEYGSSSGDESEYEGRRDEFYDPDSERR